MKIPNYMVGDWVYINKSPQQIAAVHQRKVGYHRRDDRLEWAFLDRVTPIPISPEFLLKNGFIKEKDYYIFERRAGDGRFSITLYDYFDGIWGMVVEDYDLTLDCSIKKEVSGDFLKVHQVQHECVELGIKIDFIL